MCVHPLHAFLTCLCQQNPDPHFAYGAQPGNARQQQRPRLRERRKRLRKRRPGMVLTMNFEVPARRLPYSVWVSSSDHFYLHSLSFPPDCLADFVKNEGGELGFPISFDMLVLIKVAGRLQNVQQFLGSQVAAEVIGSATVCLACPNRNDCWPADLPLKM